MSTANYQQWPVGSTQTQYLLTKQVLDRAEAFERLPVACDERTLAANSGSSLVLTRWVNPSVSSTPEAEGQNPVTRALQPEQFSGTMQRYSVAYATSNYNATLNPLDWVKGMSDVLATEVRSTRERIRWLAANSGTNRIFNTSSITVRTDVNGVITLGRLQKAISSIEASKGRPMTSEGGGTTKVGTSPTEAGYLCFVHTDAHPDIRAIPGFTKKAEMSPGNYPEGTFGCVDNVVFVTSPEFNPYLGAGASTSTMRATGGNTDVYPYVLCAKGSLVSIKLSGSERGGFGNGKANILDKADKSDYTNSRIIVSASWYDLCISASDDWRVVIECGVTANPA
jgi:N4-gp56 family major capsid protein